MTQTTPPCSRISSQYPETIQEAGIALELFLVVVVVVFQLTKTNFVRRAAHSNSQELNLIWLDTRGLMNVYWDFTPKLPALKAGVVEVKYMTLYGKLFF